MAAILRSARNLARVLLLLLLRGAFGGFAVLHPLSAFVLPFRSAPQEGSALNPSCSPLALRKKAVTATVGTIFSASMDLQMSSPEESEAVRPALSSFEGTIQLTGIIARRKSVGKWLHFVTLEIPECELTACNGVTAPVLQLPVIVKFEDMPLPNSLKKGNRISVECTDDPDSRAMQVDRWDSDASPPARVQAVAQPVDLGAAEQISGGAGHTILMGVNGWKGSLCRAWVRGQKDTERGCTDPNCLFRHAYLPGEETVVARQDRQAAAARAEAVDEDDPHREGKEGKSKHNRIFAAWLIETFGVELLRSQGGVVDIAGGGGAVSEILELEHGVPCTLIDPRPLRLSAQRRRRIRKLTTRRRAEGAVVPAGVAQGDSESDPLGALLGVDGSGRAGKEPETEARGNWHGPAGLRSAPFRHIVQEFPGEAGDAALAAAAAASVLIGMHSDDATEPIVDAALSLGKPFAVRPLCPSHTCRHNGHSYASLLYQVVPCCVFPSRHPHRRTPQGPGTHPQDNT